MSREDIEAGCYLFKQDTQKRSMLRSYKQQRKTFFLIKVKYYIYLGQRDNCKYIGLYGSL